MIFLFQWCILRLHVYLPGCSTSFPFGCPSTNPPIAFVIGNSPSQIYHRICPRMSRKVVEINGDAVNCRPPIWVLTISPKFHRWWSSISLVKLTSVVISQANFTQKKSQVLFAHPSQRELRGEVSKGFHRKISTHPKQKTENGVSILVGGFNPFEKYQSNWIISPGRGENQKYLKPPPRIVHGHQPQKRMLSFLKSMFFLASSYTPEI